jgi:hypothetical protein
MCEEVRSRLGRVLPAGAQQAGSWHILTERGKREERERKERGKREERERKERGKEEERERKERGKEEEREREE